MLNYKWIPLRAGFRGDNVNIRMFIQPFAPHETRRERSRILHPFLPFRYLFHLSRDPHFHCEAKVLYIVSPENLFMFYSYAHSTLTRIKAKSHPNLPKSRTKQVNPFRLLATYVFRKLCLRCKPRTAIPILIKLLFRLAYFYQLITAFIKYSMHILLSYITWTALHQPAHITAKLFS